MRTIVKEGAQASEFCNLTDGQGIKVYLGEFVGSVKCIRRLV
jgi:hypothetical protein